MDTSLLSAAVPTLTDVALKGAALLTLAGLATAALWRASAALRHLVWSLTMAGLLALPILSALLPQWQALPQWSALRAPIRTAAAPSPAMPAPPATLTPVAQSQSRVVPDTVAANVAPPSPIRPAAVSPAAAKPSVPWSVWLLRCWILGVALVFLPIIVGRLALWRLSRSARPIEIGPWTTLLQILALEMRLRRRVTLLRSDRPVMPMAWGIRRAHVLLPAESDGWTSERRRAVLLHEIAHVRRGDCLTQLLTNLACAMHWFNPLVWVARRRMVTERERACDDMVLAAGFEPSDYAQHLLQIASGLRGGLLTSGAAIAMARPSKLEGRLLAVLDTKRNRRALTRKLTFAVGIVLLCALIPLACLQYARGNEQKPPQDDGTSKATPSRFIADFTGGGTVELLGVSYHPSQGKPWWKPDGKRFEQPPIIAPTGRLEAPNKAPYELVFRLSGFPKGSDPRWTIRPGGGTAYGIQLPDGRVDPDLIWTTALFSKDALKGEIKVGASIGTWQTEGEGAADHESSQSRDRAGEDFFVSFTKGYERDGKATVTVTHTIRDANADVRVVAVDDTGREHSSAGGSGTGNGQYTVLTVPFDVPLAQVKLFRLQARPIQWVEFRDVALAPSSKPAAPSVPAAAILQFRLVDEAKEKTGVPVKGAVKDFMTGQDLYVLPDVLLSEADMQSAVAEQDDQGRWNVQLTFTPEGRLKFAQITKANVGRRLAILFEDHVVSAPVIMSELKSRNGIISVGGENAREEAQRIVDLIMRGKGVTAEQSALFPVTDEEQFADLVEERFVEALKGQELPFLNDKLLRAIRSEVTALVARTAPADLSADQRQAILGALEPYVTDYFTWPALPSDCNWNYLDFGDRLKTFEWKLGLALGRQPLDEAAATQLAAQIEWMKQHISGLPEEPPAYTRAKSLARLKAVCDDPLCPLFHEPMTEAQFDTFKKKVTSYDEQPFVVSHVVPYMVSAALNATYGSEGFRLPFDDKIDWFGIRNEHVELRFESNSFFVGREIFLGDVEQHHQVLDVKEGLISFPETLKSQAEVDRWLGERGQGDFGFDDAKGGGLFAVRGARLVMLNVPDWIVADGMNDDELRALFTKQGRETVPLREAAAQSRTDRARRENDFPGAFVGVLTGDGRLAVVQITIFGKDNVIMRVRRRAGIAPPTTDAPAR